MNDKEQEEEWDCLWAVEDTYGDVVSLTKSPEKGYEWDLPYYCIEILPEHEVDPFEVLLSKRDLEVLFHKLKVEFHVPVS